MPRPRCFRRICGRPSSNYFKPAGIPLAVLEESVVSADEFEAVRLKDFEGLEQEEAAVRMRISQSTFHRILSSARKKIAEAIVKGKAVRIEHGQFIEKRRRS